MNTAQKLAANAARNWFFLVLYMFGVTLFFWENRIYFWISFLAITLYKILESRIRYVKFKKTKENIKSIEKEVSKETKQLLEDMMSDENLSPEEEELKKTVKKSVYCYSLYEEYADEKIREQENPLSYYCWLENKFYQSHQPQKTQTAN